MEHPIEGLMQSAMGNIKGMVDVDTIIGEPVTAPDGTIIVPVSSVTFGFGAGGSDFGPKKGTEINEKLFGGGCGGGASVKPAGFLVVTQSSVRFIPMNGGSSPVDKLVDMLPGMVDKLNETVGSAIRKKRSKSEERKDDII